MSTKTSSTTSSYTKKSRENTKEEKRRMKAKRKKKLRKLKVLAAVEDVKKSLAVEIKLKENAQKEFAKYKSMSRTYWERWRWELEKRNGGRNAITITIEASPFLWQTQ